MVFQRCGLFLAMAIVLLPLAAAAQSNPIVIENQQPGTSQWRIPWGFSADDVNGQIKGYAEAVSVNKGENITFHISVNPSQVYTIDVYRIGWYQGMGGRLMQHIGPLNGTPQPTCPTDAVTGMIECHWAAAYTLTTGTTWTSGIYLALLKNQNNFQNYILFCVRDDNRVAPLLFQQTVTTYQAYNDYPNDNKTGKSLYLFNSYGARTSYVESPGAAKVSFDRPYDSDGTGAAWGNTVLLWEVSFIRWMEMSGYDVTYQTDIDTHVNPGRLLNYRGILSVGHDEYWSKPMYDGWIAARDAGVNLGFFGADPDAWQVRFEPSSSGVPNRVLVCYRDANQDPINDPTLKTVEWLGPPLNRPEQTLVGVEYTHQILWQQQFDGYAPYVVTNSSNWVYAGTGFKDGDSVPGLIGYEADRFFNNFPGPNAVSGTFTLLSNSPFQSNAGVSDFSNSSVYQAPSGAWVFGAGTMGWAYGLDDFTGHGTVDARIQQTTANILNRFINPANNFSLAASPISGPVIQGSTASFNVTITPTGNFNSQVTLSVSGLPSGASPGFTPNPATTSSTLSVSTSTTTPPGTYPLTITGVSGTLTHTATATLVVNPRPDFSLSASPSSQSVNPGGGTSYNVAINPIGGFSDQVTLSLTGQPGGVTPTFTPNPATSSATLSLNTSATTPVGTYTLTITGVDGGLSHSTTVTLVVALPDFTLVASPSSSTVSPGGSANFTVVIAPIAGFGGQVTFGVTGLPANTTNNGFNPNPATSSSTLTVTTSSTTPPGTFPLTITGVSGVLSHSAQVSLTVTPPGVKYDNTAHSGFQWGVTSITTPVFTVGTGTKRAAMIMVAMDSNNATNLTATLGGVQATLVPGTDTGTTAGSRTVIFCVLNPPAGAQTATASWTTSMNADVGVITVSGADQTTPCTNGANSASNAQPTPTGSVTVTSTSGDLTASVAATGGTWVSPFTNQILKWGVDSGETGGDIGPGTGTTTHTWSDTWSWQIHAISGANFKASATP